MTTLLEAAKAVAKAWREFVTDPHVPPLLAELERSIAAAESAPAVVTPEEISEIIRTDGYTPPAERPLGTPSIADEVIAALVAARTAAAVAAARAEERASAREVAFAAAKEAMEIERAACARVADSQAAQFQEKAVRTPERSRQYVVGLFHGAEACAATIRARGQSEAPAPAPAALSEEALGDIRRTLRDKEDALPFSQQLDLLGEVTRLRAREARVQALVEAAEGVLRWLDTSTGLPSEIALRAALDALEETR